MADTPEIPDLPNPKTAALLAWLVPGLGHLYQGRRAKGVLFMASIMTLFTAGMVIGEAKVAYASTLPVSRLGSFAYDGWPFLCQSGIGFVAIPGWIERSQYLSGQESLLVSALYPPPTGRKAEQIAALRSGLEQLLLQSNPDVGLNQGRLYSPDREAYLKSFQLKAFERRRLKEILGELDGLVGQSVDGELVSFDPWDKMVRHPDGPAKRRYDLGFRFEVGMVYTVIAGLLNILVVYDAHSGPMLPEEDKKEKEENPTNSD